MAFAEPLPKKNASEVEEGGLIFCPLQEGVREIVKSRPAVKSLFVVDGGTLSVFKSCMPPHALCVVLDSEECLPLFLSSDDAPFVVAAGGRNTLVAARFFAEIRKLPCALFPAFSALDGAFEETGEVVINKRTERVRLKEAKIYCDEELMRPTAGRAYMRLLLSRLALIEAKAMRGFGISYGNEKAEERAFGALLSLKAETLDFKRVVLKNAEIRRCEQGGMNAGEGIILAEEPCGEERAFRLLSALYSAFLEKGKPRLFVPDYEARARSADAPYAKQKIPTVQEWVHRATRFERMRAELFRELNAFLNGELHYSRNYFSLAGCAPAGVGSLLPLKTLPERTAGLSSVIRDFGLMEWDENAFHADIL